VQLESHPTPTKPRKSLEKLVAYIDHAEIVNGTRIVEQLREHSTQLSTFMNYGNFFVGKLLEPKHLGRGTFTDVGTTYKLLRRDTLARLMPVLNPAVSLEFNVHFLDAAIAHGARVVECSSLFIPGSAPVKAETRTTFAPWQWDSE